MTSLSTLLEDKRVLLADGAWTTALQDEGLPQGEAAEAWNLSHEAAVRALAHAYASMPVDILTTNTFAALDASCMERGIAIACGAATDATLVGAALGPYDRDPATYEMIHAAGARACVLETQLDVASSAAATAAARAAELEVVASFTFFRDDDGTLSTRCGMDPAHAAGRALEAGAHVVGANCCDGPATVCDALAVMAAAHPGVPLWAKPNAGLPRKGATGLVYPESPEAMAAWALRLAEAGARIVGGCCGCGPAHIAAMASALRGATRP